MFNSKGFGQTHRAEACIVNGNIDGPSSVKNLQHSLGYGSLVSDGSFPLEMSYVSQKCYQIRDVPAHLDQARRTADIMARRNHMIKVSVLYPNDEGAHFDMEYYCGRHVPMVRARLGTACKGVSVERGLAGGAPGSRPAFIVMGHLYFDTVEAFQASFGPHATEIMQDIPKYTNLQPIVQISEVTIPLELAAAI